MCVNLPLARIALSAAATLWRAGGVTALLCPATVVGTDTQQGSLTEVDRQSLATSALAVAVLQMSDVTDAIQHASNGDKSAIEQVMEKGAANLGMPSTAMLREQILPSLGINVP